MRPLRRATNFTRVLAGLALALASTTSARAGHPPDPLDRALWQQDAPAPKTAAALLAPLPAASPIDADWVAMPLPTLIGASCALEFEGRLWIGGGFTAAGLQFSPHIAAWDGARFVAVPDPGFPVLSLAVWRDSLWAGGGTAGEAHVSRWTGQHWESVGVGTYEGYTGVCCLEVFEGDLIVAGGLDTMNGVPITS